MCEVNFDPFFLFSSSPSISYHFLLPLLAQDNLRMGVSIYDVCTFWGPIFFLYPLFLSWMLGVWVLFLSVGIHILIFILMPHHSFFVRDTFFFFGFGLFLLLVVVMAIKGRWELVVWDSPQHVSSWHIKIESPSPFSLNACLSEWCESPPPKENSTKQKRKMKRKEKSKTQRPTPNKLYHPISPLLFSLPPWIIIIFKKKWSFYRWTETSDDFWG